MEITEIRIKLMEEPGERLRAFCSMTLDGAFVIRDLKIIDGTNGPFVAMPSRKLTSRCGGCGSKNHLRAQYCNQCGQRIKQGRANRDDDGRAKLYADIAHPINSACREMIQQQLILAYEEEVERSKQPGYIPSYFDYDCEDSLVEMDDDTVDERRPAPKGRTAVVHDRETHRPHKVPSHQRNGQTCDAQRDGFGAGIF